jgi:ProP effector
MKQDSGKVPKEKPVVIIRKKAGPKNAPTGPTQAKPKTASPVMKATKPAIPTQPQPVPQPVPPQASAPPTVTEAGPSTQEQKRQAQRALLEVLRQRWPHAFPRDARQVRPLAIGIHRDLAAALPGHSHRQLGAVFSLFRYLAGPAYFQALLHGGPRYDLEGNPRGEVTPEEQEQAKQDLAAFFERRKRKRASSVQPPHENPSSTGVDRNKM